MTFELTTDGNRMTEFCCHGQIDAENSEYVN